MTELNVSSEPRGRKWVRWGLGALFVVAGALHFITPDTYVRVMPPYIPAPRLMVLVSGFFEIAGGVGLLVPRLRRAAAWGLVALLVAVFPANIYMALHPGVLNLDVPVWALWLRLPLQVVLIAAVLWAGGVLAARRTPHRAR